jgi:hypothetical protein
MNSCFNRFQAKPAASQMRERNEKHTEIRQNELTESCLSSFIEKINFTDSGAGII